MSLLLQSSSHETNRLALIKELERLAQEFPNEDSANEALYWCLASQGLVACRHCGSSDVGNYQGSRTVKCSTCAKKIWITAGTFFHKIKKVRPLLLIICLIEAGFVLTSSTIHELLGITQSSALMMLKKVRLAVVQDGDAVWNIPVSAFVSVITKRSRQTQAGQHPESELPIVRPVQAADVAPTGLLHPGQAKDDLQAVTDVSHDSEDDISGRLLELVGDEPVHVDELCEQTLSPVGEIGAALVTLELFNKVTRLAGDRYVRFRGSDRPKKSMVGAQVPSHFVAFAAQICKFLKHSFHGVSGKHLQGYLAAYWCYLDRQRWTPNSLMRLCVQFGRPIPYREIVAGLCPTSVSIFRCPDLS